MVPALTLEVHKRMPRQWLPWKVVVCACGSERHAAFLAVGSRKMNGRQFRPGLEIWFTVGSATEKLVTFWKIHLPGPISFQIVT